MGQSILTENKQQQQEANAASLPTPNNQSRQ
jgi:hypothetical protein